MTKSVPLSPCVLIASDSPTEARQVKSMLDAEFERVFVSTDPENAVQDFDRYCPGVLVLAFNGLEKSEQHNLGLYRQSEKIHQHPHRTVILCSKVEVWRAYELCRKELFDDYILFWPMSFDAPRLAMSVHSALRELAALRSSGPSAAEFAVQARRLASLEKQLEQFGVEGELRIGSSDRAVVQTERDIASALDALVRRLQQNASSDPMNAEALNNVFREVELLKKGELHQRFLTLTESVQPVRQWVEDFTGACAPHLASARALGEMASRVRPTVLIVDDDEFLRKLVARILEPKRYQLLFAINGAEALNVLRKARPDLILMDIQMPVLDGIETLRRIRANPDLAMIPVVMITGKSVGQVVIDSLKAGACDFVVKPFDTKTLLDKVAGLV